jgi:ketosteroid isomerase-like protein
MPEHGEVMFTKLSRALPILILFNTSCQSAGDHQTAQPEFDTQAHVDAWVELWNTYDLSRLEELFLWDSTVTYFSSEREGVIQGPAGLREHHRGMGFVDGGKPAEQELWVEDVESGVYGSTAIVTAVWFFGDRGDPAESVQRGPMTMVYVRANGGYRIAHMHFANY